MPKDRRRAEALGERIRLARLRRGVPLVEAAARIGVTPTTFRKLERGEPSVSVAVLIRALGILGLDEDMDRIASDDPIGRRLEDLRLVRPRRTAARRSV